VFPGSGFAQSMDQVLTPGTGTPMADMCAAALSRADLEAAKGAPDQVAARSPCSRHTALSRIG